jgi:hypothetical protein
VPQFELPLVALVALLDEPHGREFHLPRFPAHDEVQRDRQCDQAGASQQREMEKSHLRKG